MNLIKSKVIDPLYLLVEVILSLEIVVWNLTGAGLLSGLLKMLV
jgi:hypothetical protein